MVATIISLVLSMYMGAIYDEISRLILDIMFTGLFLFLFRRFFNRPLEHFLWVGIISMLPYFVWYIFDAAMPTAHRLDSLALLKTVPIATVIILGLDTVFRFMRNRQY